MIRWRKFLRGNEISRIVNSREVGAWFGQNLSDKMTVSLLAVNTKKDSESAPVKGGTMTDLGKEEGGSATSLP